MDYSTYYTSSPSPLNKQNCMYTNIILNFPFDNVSTAAQLIFFLFMINFADITLNYSLTRAR